MSYLSLKLLELPFTDKEKKALSEADLLIQVHLAEKNGRAGTEVQIFFP